MKGIILAGGKGTRLYPITLGTCKQLLPVYDKPMIYYPLSVLMSAGIREILLISTLEDIPRFRRILGDGSHLGISLSYCIQEKPEGIAQAFILAEAFIQDESVALILGDNIFYGHDLSKVLSQCKELESGAMIFGYEVKNPTRYGVLQWGENGQVINILEKPKKAPSPYAVTGLYFYDNTVVEIAKSLHPSSRGELEITDVNVAYLKKQSLHVHLFDRGFAWLDTGSCETLAQASNYVQTIQERQGIKIGCPEEIAYQMGFITKEELVATAEKMGESEYGLYLKSIVTIHNTSFVSGLVK